jgi:hypothetical protein
VADAFARLRWYARVAMKRHHLAGLTALTFTLAAASASAQQAQVPPGPVAPSSPPPLQAPSSAAPAPPPALTSAVRVHVHTSKNKVTAHLWIRRADGFAAVCDSPCTADIPVNSELRVTLGNNVDEPHEFVMTGDLGSEVDVEVKGPSIGPLIGGIVLMGVGGAFVLSGLLFVALGDLGKSTSSSSYSRDLASTYKTTGYVCIGLGAAAAVAGAVWLLTRSHEPQVKGAPYRDQPQRAPDVYSRGETLLGDVAVATRRDPSFTMPSPVMPLQLGFTF